MFNIVKSLFTPIFVKAISKTKLNSKNKTSKMKRKNIFHSAALLAGAFGILLSLNSCSGSKGDPGPTGATGAQGNANVVSGAITINPSDWTYNSAYNYYVDQLSDNSITSDIIANGAVMVFLSSDDVNWTALPFTSYSGGYSYTEYFTCYTGGFNLYDESSAASFSGPTNTLYIRAVVVGGNQRKMHPDVNWNNYNDIVAKVGPANITETTITKVAH